MLMNRNDRDLPVPFEGLAEQPITRSRVIKLAGATVAAGAFSIFWGTDEADALTPAQRRRRRRRRRNRRRQAAVTSPQQVVSVGTTPVAIPITNNGSTPVTIRPELVGDGFTLVNASGTPIAPETTITLDPGQTLPVFVSLDALQGGAQDATLRLVDVRDGLVLETIRLTAP